MNSILLKISEMTKDGIIAIDEKGWVLLWNRGAEKIFGYSSQEIRKTDISAIIPLRYLKQHEQAMGELSNKGEEQVEGRTMEFYGRHKSGKEFPIEATLSSWDQEGKLYFAAVVRDISKRIAIEAKNERILMSQVAVSNLLKNSIKSLSLSELLQSALETILQVSWLSINYKGAIFLLDKAQKNLVMRAEIGLAENIKNLCSSVEMGSCLCGIAAQSREIVFKNHVDADHVRGFLGTPDHGHYSIPILFNNNLLGVLTVYISANHPDNPEEREFLQTISNTLAGVIARKMGEQDLESAKIAAEVANHAKSDFLATISHEIRTPLNGIMGMTKLLMEKRLSGKKQFYVEMIQKSGDSLLRVINDVLDFSKIESGEILFEKAVFDLRETRNEFRNLFGGLAKKKNLRFRTRIARKVPRHVIGDRHRINQILINLLSNAMKFTESGEIKFLIEAQEKKGQNWIYFTVEDSGIGMRNSVLDTLFQPFTQADTSTTRRYGGTGLGLTICKKLTSLMNGHLHVVSSEGAGSRFILELPLETTNTAEPPQDERKKLEFFLFSKKTQVLVVEDNLVNQRLFQIILKKMGIRVTTANNGIEALERLKKEKFDCVLMDCHMPEMDGLEAIQIFRQSEGKGRKQRLPIIAVTADAMEGKEESCIRAGFDSFITKPVNKQELQALLLQLIPSNKVSKK